MSVYDEVTQAIIAELEQGVPGFRQHPHGNRVKTNIHDTNVIVSAILKPGSIPASLVALAMEGAVRLFLR
jgi:hypothetical protein